MCYNFVKIHETRGKMTLRTDWDGLVLGCELEEGALDCEGDCEGSDKPLDCEGACEGAKDLEAFAFPTDVFFFDAFPFVAFLLPDNFFVAPPFEETFFVAFPDVLVFFDATPATAEADDATSMKPFGVKSSFEYVETFCFFPFL